MSDMPLVCPGCGADMRGGRLSSVIDPSARHGLWRAVYCVEWVDMPNGERPKDSQIGWLCPNCWQVLPLTGKIPQGKGAVS